MIFIENAEVILITIPCLIYHHEEDIPQETDIHR